MPVKPSTPATIDTRKKIRAHFRIVTAGSINRGRRSGAIDLCNFQPGNRFLMRAIAESGAAGPEHTHFALPISAAGGTFTDYLDKA